MLVLALLIGQTASHHGWFEFSLVPKTVCQLYVNPLPTVFVHALKVRIVFIF